ncbi:MAG: tRNA uridine-5-carboxymethylaminomethyl(34) synthesis GTPase MnmE [Alicyclobacillus sp.]|nr:tRNA uridine-5-carboxymethylaminomethyl(34) synthesis GTPase MnmE [Alicyclobacillus sp.]
MVPVDADTIAAIATALGEAGVGIVRVSGDHSWSVAQRLFETASGRPLRNRRRGLHYGRVVDPDSAMELDECVLLWMPGPHSYTGEDVVEFQVHGGIQLVQSVLRAALRAGARLAEPGEFTKRAFLNGRMDLSQAEAVIDLIRAKTDLASRSALRQVQGALSREVARLRKELLRLQAHVEVTIDYPEHDVESVAATAVVETGGRVIRALDDMLNQARFGQVLREGVRTAIVGRPNVGKSSLLNALLQRDRAIVTEIAGTTRDVLEEVVNVGGVPFRLADTAGVRETADVVEQMGVERTRQTVRDAQFVLVVLSAVDELAAEDWELLAQTTNTPRVLVVNKADLVDEARHQAWRARWPEETVVCTSMQTGEGLPDLREAMVAAVNRGHVEMEDLSYLGNARQLTLLQRAREELQLGVEAADSGATLDIVAVQLQEAYRALGLVIGEEAGEDLLDEIFSNFCLGK